MARAQEHKTTLNQNSDQFAEVDSFSSNELSLDSNVYTQTFKLSIDDGEGYRPGRGASANPLQAQGFVAMHFRDNTGTNANQITGSVRLTVRTSGAGRLVSVLESWDLESIDSRDNSNNLIDRKDREPMPRPDPRYWTSEYDLYLEVKPDADDTIDTSPDSQQTEVFMDAMKVERVA